jgi:adenine phosphoribosyltransferase
MNLTDYIKDIPDFPKKGILFRDISPLLKSPEGWSKVMTQLGLLCEELTPDLIVGIESRGFIVGSALATSQKLGFVPIRKKGKLPGDLLGVDYTLEYGKDRLEIQSDALQGNPRVLLVDDLLATGGTVNASTELIEKAGGQLVGCGFIIELNELNGRENVPNVPIRSLIRYD